MGRCGMRSFTSLLVVLSLAVLVFFNQHIAAFSSSSLSMGASSESYGMEGLHSSMVGGEEMARRRLQQVVNPAPAPGPSAAGSGDYIGYGVLTAGYVPCPPQTGRSYYTSNCQSTTAPVNPYTRGCSTITLCARG
ncbi:unnamed protein product [Calypogeia fissa]